MGRGPNPNLNRVADQGKEFIDAARALECDESEERFDAALKKIATHKPTEKKPEAEKSKTKR